PRMALACSVVLLCAGLVLSGREMYVAMQVASGAECERRVDADGWVAASPACADDGWKLMGPPIRFQFSSDFEKARQQAQDIARRDASVDVKAELLRWQPIYTFDTRSECMRAAFTFNELLGLSEDTYKLLEKESGSLRTYEAYLLSLHHARCFSFAELRSLGLVI